MFFGLTNPNTWNVVITLKTPKCCIHNPVTMQLWILQFFCLFVLVPWLRGGGVGVNVQLSPAAFPALWGCCQKWSIHIFVLHIWKEDAMTHFNFSWECAISCSSSHGASSFYRNRGCLSFPLLEQPSSLWATAPWGYLFSVARNF